MQCMEKTLVIFSFVCLVWKGEMVVGNDGGKNFPGEMSECISFGNLKSTQRTKKMTE